jgi:hypothetical protein
LLAFYLNRIALSDGPAGFIREMGYAYDVRGTQAARAIVYDKRPYNIHDYPLFNRIATISLGIVVHTQAARKRILSEVLALEWFALPWRRMFLPVPLPAGQTGWRDCRRAQ